MTGQKTNQMNRDGSIQLPVNLESAESLRPVDLLNFMNWIIQR